MTSYTECYVYGKNVMEIRHKQSWVYAWEQFIKITTKLKNSGYDLTQIHLVCEDGRGKDDRERISETCKQNNE